MNEQEKEHAAGMPEDNYQENDDTTSLSDTADNLTDSEITADGDQPALSEEQDADGIPDTNKLQEELESVKDKYIRLVAEFDNFRRRNARERVELVQTAGKDVLLALLPILDDIDRATKQITEDAATNPVNEGIMLIFNKMHLTLQQKGLKKMDCVGRPFDADVHEAITEIPAPSEELKGKIMDETEPGYYLNDKLIRYAKVIVGK